MGGVSHIRVMPSLEFVILAVTHWHIIFVDVLPRAQTSRNHSLKFLSFLHP